MNIELPCPITVVVISMGHPDNINDPCVCTAKRWKVMDKFTNLGLANLSVEFLGLKAATDDNDYDSRHRMGPDSCKLKCVLRCHTFIIPYIMITTTENYKKFFVDDFISEMEFLSKTYFRCHKVIGDILVPKLHVGPDVMEHTELILRDYLDTMFPIDIILPYPVTVVIISMDHGDNIVDSCSCTKSRWKVMDKFKELGLENLSVGYLGLKAATENQGFGHRHTVHPVTNPSFLKKISVFPTVMITSTGNWEMMGEIDEAKFLSKCYFNSYNVVDGALVRKSIGERVRFNPGLYLRLYLQKMNE